jgi:uncharacterized membrane protein HdeD (DUF308 family)
MDVTRGEISTAIPALLGLGLIVAGLVIMVAAIRQRSTPTSLLGLALAALGVALVILDIPRPT